MVQSVAKPIDKPIDLEGFLQLPETKPASEYIDGRIIQKPMPQGQHSTLQRCLTQHIDDRGYQLKAGSNKATISVLISTSRQKIRKALQKRSKGKISYP